jgi:hypothetical protein
MYPVARQTQIIAPSTELKTLQGQREKPSGTDRKNLEDRERSNTPGLGENYALRVVKKIHCTGWEKLTIKEQKRKNTPGAGKRLQGQGEKKASGAAEKNAPRKGKKCFKGKRKRSRGRKRKPLQGQGEGNHTGNNCVKANKKAPQERTKSIPRAGRHQRSRKPKKI